MFDQYQLSLIKPAFAKALQLDVTAFEIFVTSDVVPASVGSTPAFYVVVNIPVTAPSRVADVVVDMAARLRERGLETLRTAVSQMIAAWNAPATGMSSTSSQPSLAAAALPVYNDQRVSVTESGAVSMSLFDRSVMDAPLPVGDTVTLSKGAIAGIVIGSFIGVVLLGGLIAWASFRAGSKHAYEQISQNGSGSSQQQQQQQSETPTTQQQQQPQQAPQVVVSTTQIEMVEA